MSPPEPIVTPSGTGGNAAASEPNDLSWVMSAMWLVFLGFTLYAAVIRPGAVWLRVVAVGLVVAFAAVYLVTFRQAGRAATRAEAHRVGVTGYLLLALVGVALWLVLGPATLGVLTYLGAVAGFILRWRWAVAGVVAAITSSVILSVAAGLFPGAWWYFGITTLVGVFALILRVFESREERHRELTHALALSDERDRVARDVHDVLGHSLTVLAVKAEVAERMVDLDPDRAKSELVEIQALTRQSLAEIRSTVSGLRVARLTDEAARAEEALAAAGIEADLPDDAMVVDPTHRITIAWALREAVTNVVRHSRARRCTVSWGPDWLEVVDDGRGVRPGSEGNGIRGLRERVAPGGGTVVVDAGPDGRGTRLRVALGRAG